jgi:hypothetical protein
VTLEDRLNAFEETLMGSTKKDKKVAHFVRVPELVGSPQNEALISAYLD